MSGIGILVSLFGAAIGIVVGLVGIVVGAIGGSLGLSGHLFPAVLIVLGIVWLAKGAGRGTCGP